MANQDHIELVKQGARALAEWHDAHPDAVLDLSGANLRRMDLVHAPLNRANFEGAKLEWADFRWADLINANFSRTTLARADFHKADMQKVNLESARLLHTNFEDANLQRAMFDYAVFGHTRLFNCDLAGATGLNNANHASASLLDEETIQKSGALPAIFLKGCGISDPGIEAARKSEGKPVPIRLYQDGAHYSAFISHSSTDQKFVTKLYGDLQDAGVRCWYAPEDMKIGRKILDSLYEGIRTHEKLLLVLSEHCVNSNWVEDEVNKAFAEERDRRESVVFPVRVDDTVMTSQVAWAQKIRDDRHIGDFTKWENQSEYHKSLKRLLRDLQR